MKTNLFFAAGLIAREAGSERLERVGGLLRQRPLLAVLFAIPALSLAGLPPLSGFFAKFLVVREAFASGALLWGGVALAVGLLTLFSMTKIWLEAFWKPHPGRFTSSRSRKVQLIPVAGLATLTISLGFLAEPLFALADEAAAQLIGGAPVPEERLANHP